MYPYLVNKLSRIPSDEMEYHDLINLFSPGLHNSKIIYH